VSLIINSNKDFLKWIGKVVLLNSFIHINSSVNMVYKKLENAFKTCPILFLDMAY